MASEKVDPEMTLKIDVKVKPKVTTKFAISILQILFIVLIENASHDLTKLDARLRVKLVCRLNVV